MSRKWVAIGTVFAVSATIGGLAFSHVIDRRDPTRVADPSPTVSSRPQEVTDENSRTDDERERIEGVLADKVLRDLLKTPEGESIDFDSRDPERGIEPPTAHEPD